MSILSTAHEFLVELQTLDVEEDLKEAFSGADTFFIHEMEAGEATDDLFDVWCDCIMTFFSRCSDCQDIREDMERSLVGGR